MTGKITVYCGDPAHERWDIDVFERGEDGIWRPVEAGLKGAERSLRLLGGELMPHVPGRARWKYRFECEKCRITVPVRGEKMMPLFDRLVDAGHPEISLRGVRRVVG